MNKTLFLAMAALFASVAHAEQPAYQLKTLTFEGLSNKIDQEQYGGPLLYGDGMGFYSQEEAYQWTDSANTGLSHVMPMNWGSYCYWGGGHAISHYVSGQDSTYGDYNSQLTVYKEGILGIQITQGGHNGSDNFVVHTGYTDQSGFSADNLPSITFYDGKARIVDHMYITNTCYVRNVLRNGNGLSDKAREGDWVQVLAIGYDAKGAITDTAKIYLCEGPNRILSDWTKFDLSSLGRVARIEFNMTGSCDNGYGFSLPAYFAYDDVAVRFYEGDELPSSVGTAIAMPLTGTSHEAHKIMRNGQILIIRDGKTYNAQGSLIN